MVRTLFAAVMVAVVGGFALAADLKSGPQAGDKLAGPFHPLNVNGESAGKKACLYCKHGENPVAMVFARTLDESTEKLIVALEKVTAANTKCDMGCFVVFLSDDDKLADKLKDVSDKLKLKTVTLAVDNPAGPKGYNVAKDADLTVVLYTERTSKVNMSFEKGKLTEKDIEAVVAGVSKITPSK
jgi:hypothetical protein